MCVLNVLLLAWALEHTRIEPLGRFWCPTLQAPGTRPCTLPGPGPHQGGLTPPSRHAWWLSQGLRSPGGTRDWPRAVHGQGQGARPQGVFEPSCSALPGGEERGSPCLLLRGNPWGGRSAVTAVPCGRPADFGSDPSLHGSPLLFGCDGLRARLTLQLSFAGVEHASEFPGI